METVAANLAELKVGGDLEGEESVLAQDGVYVEEDCGEEDELLFVDDGSGQSPEANKFDAIVGVLEDFLMDPKFEDVQSNFCKKHCCQFDDDDENKLEYHDIFTKYTAMLESSIEAKLKSEGYDMQEFLGLIETHEDELNGDVFDLLMSLSDFASFKELMLDYKKSSSQPAGTGLTIEVGAATVHVEDEEEGEQRPDLDNIGLQISPVRSPGVKPTF